MELANYKACICEGSAENAIMDILLDYNLLIFNREEMIEEEVIRCREAKKFEEKYLRKGFKDKISVIRILDSRGENFKLSKAYAGKVDVSSCAALYAGSSTVPVYPITFANLMAFSSCRRIAFS